MNVSASIPATVEIRLNRLLGLIVVVAALAASITYVVVVLAFDDGHSTAASSVRTGASAPVSSAAQDARRVPSLMSLTPARLAAGALGSSYALPYSERPDVGVCAGLDEPGDAALHQAGHGADVRAVRCRGRRQPVEPTAAGRERIVPPLPPR